MKGFLKRDIYLLMPVMKLYGAIFLCFVILSFFTDFPLSMVVMYICLFIMAGVTGLFNYDAFNHWQTYAAAIPDGRTKQVDARYILCILASLFSAMLLGILDLVAQENFLQTFGAAYIGVCLFYSSVTLPFSYRFGGNKSRIIVIAVCMLIGGLAGGLGSVGAIVDEYGSFPDFPVSMPALNILIILVSSGLMFLSWRISRGIMRRKEF